jgi:hypothetical protein
VVEERVGVEARDVDALVAAEQGLHGGRGGGPGVHEAGEVVDEDEVARHVQGPGAVHVLHEGVQQVAVGTVHARPPQGPGGAARWCGPLPVNVGPHADDPARLIPVRLVRCGGSRCGWSRCGWSGPRRPRLPLVQTSAAQVPPPSLASPARSDSENP